MCRDKKYCIELGTNIKHWDKLCPLPKPIWISEQMNIFESAVNDFLIGQKDSCITKLKEIKNEEIIDWYIEHGQMSGKHRKKTLNIPIPKLISEELRDSIRSPKKIQDEVFKRDGYRCRYCNNKLISQEFIRLFIKKLNFPLFQRDKTNLKTHGIIHISWPVADHVIPWNQGGRTDLNNLVSSCATCNYGKDGYTLEQIGIENPFFRQPIVDNWNGFTNRIKELNEII